MGDPYPYGLPDLQQLIAGRSSHHDLAEPPCLGGVHAGAAAPTTPIPNNYNVVFSHGFATTFAPSNHHQDYTSSVVNIIPPSTNPTVSASTLANHGTTTAFRSSSSMEAAEKGWLGFDAGANNRWPRQETLLLLEIRSRLDSKFRETNHKAPLWSEISRIMSEEYGYQRSGKKCKEKFENLYKYYKKTKEGKAGRQDGKHYRFFRQLEAICGEPTANITTSASYQSPLMTQLPDGEEVLHHNINNNMKYCSKSLSLSNNSSDQFDTSSSENNDDKELSAIAYMMKQKQVEMDSQIRHSGVRERKSLRVEVEEIVDSNMRKIIETQEAWMEKMMSVVEHREQEMVYKEEERKKDSIRFDQEVHQLWAKERAWMATRDTALMEVVKKQLGKELPTVHHQPTVEEYKEEPQTKNKNNGGCGQNWRFQI